MPLPLMQSVAGITAKPHGYKGWLKVYNTTGNLVDLLNPKEWVFLMIQNKPVPFFLEDISEYQEDKIAVKFLGINTVEQAEKLSGFALHLPLLEKNTSKKLVDTATFLSSQEIPLLEGFGVIDASNNQLIGQIDWVQQNVNQWIISVVNQDREWLLPLHQDLVENLDVDKNQLVLHIPEGLLALEQE